LWVIESFASWLHKERPLLGEDPFAGVRFTQVEDPQWNGLSNSEITRLKSACELRMKACKKKHQNPLSNMPYSQYCFPLDLESLSLLV
jgi:integrase/recombinase XerD